MLIEKIHIIYYMTMQLTGMYYPHGPVSAGHKLLADFKGQRIT